MFFFQNLLLSFSYFLIFTTFFFDILIHLKFSYIQDIKTIGIFLHLLYFLTIYIATFVISLRFFIFLNFLYLGDFNDLVKYRVV